MCQRLTKLVESYIDAKTDDTSIRIVSRKAKRMGLVFCALGCLLGTAWVFMALKTREEQRANELLPVKGMSGEGEIVRRFVAPNGVTKRIEFRVAGSKVKNVEIDPLLWDQLEHATTVPVICVPEEPDIIDSNLERSRIRISQVRPEPDISFVCLEAWGTLFPRF